MNAKTNTSGLSLETGMLAFSRSLQVTEAVFFGLGRKKDGETFRVPVEVREKGVRGQSSEDNAKKPGLSNPQAVEIATVPQGCDRIALDFAVRVLPNGRKPSACNSIDVVNTYEALTREYARAGGYRHLAELYVGNIANGRFAWRNRFQSDAMQVDVTFDNETVTFDPLQLDLDRPADIAAMKTAVVGGDTDAVDRLIDGVAEALAGPASFVFEVEWRAEMIPGQEIFPSQEYLRAEKVEASASRVYAKIPVYHGGRELMQASMHSQKIGAALRHIDVWHGDNRYGAIAVNPYGGVQETGDALRPPRSKGAKSFYDIRRKPDDLMHNVETAETIGDIADDVHFFVANLVRGGVFGASSKKAEAA